MSRDRNTSRREVPDEIDELRIIATYLDSHPDIPQLTLEREPLSETAALSLPR